MSTSTHPGADQIVAAVRETERAMLAAESATLGGIRGDRAFDPGYSPRMYERANAIVRQLRTSHEVTYIDEHKGQFYHQQLRPERNSNPAPRLYDEHDPELQAAVFVHYVHKPNTVHAFRKAPTEFGWLYRTCWPQGRCIIAEAADCAGAYGGTCYLLYVRPQYILAFECCGPCFRRLEDLVEGGEILAEADAQVEFDTKAQAVAARWRAIRAEQEGQGHA